MNAFASVFQLFRDFTLGLTHGCTDRGTDGPCNNLLPKQARSNKWPKPDGTQSNNSPSNKTERKLPKTKLPLLKSQTQPQGYQDIFKSMALKGSVCACIWTSVSLQAKPCIQTTWREVKTHRVAYWQNVCMHLCATADITKTFLSHNKKKLKLQKNWTLPEWACPWNTYWSSAWRALLDYWVGCYEGLLAHHCYQSLKTPSMTWVHEH